MRHLSDRLGLKLMCRSYSRYFAILITALCLTVLTTGSTEGSSAALDTTTYVVGWGDTLSRIAYRYGTSVSAIVQANGLSNPNLIFVGQRLTIQGSGSPPSSAPTTAAGVYVVQRGDTLGAIAAHHNTTVQNLVQLNGLTNANFIIVGQRLAVPDAHPPTPPSTGGQQRRVYVVQRGDTLLGIAARFQIPMWDIVVANNIANPSLIYVGQSLVIPGGGDSTDGSPAPTPTKTPVPTNRPAAPTATVPSATPGAPTPGPGTTDAFRYAQGSMRQYPNCGTVYFKGKITGAGGEPVSGKTVRLRFAGHTVYRISGEGQDPGEWSFAPLSGENFHTPFTFLIDVIQSQSNPTAQSDVLEIHFSDCGLAGQFDGIRFEYVGGNPGPVVSATSVPTSVPDTNLTPLQWDPRLDQLPCVHLVTVAQRGIQLKPGDRYWRLVKARWLDEEESRRDVQIYVDLLDEAGQRVYGTEVVFENGGRSTVVSEKQDCCYPWDYPVKWPMFNALCSYSAHVEGLPSDTVVGMGLGTPEHPTWTVHTGFVLTFQRTVYR
jgi:LysM repeat protein